MIKFYFSLERFLNGVSISKQWFNAVTGEEQPIDFVEPQEIYQVSGKFGSSPNWSNFSLSLDQDAAYNRVASCSTNQIAVRRLEVIAASLTNPGNVNSNVYLRFINTWNTVLINCPPEDRPNENEVTQWIFGAAKCLLPITFNLSIFPVLISPPVGGGTQATAIATTANGVITAINVINPGANYTSTPSINIPVPFVEGTQATATAEVVDGAIAGVTVTNGGEGYLLGSMRMWT